MLVTAAVHLLLCAAPLKLATLGFSQIGMTDAQATFFSEHFAVQLAAVDDSVRVTTPRDIADLLGAERQRELLGCSDESSSCIAELAGALGADGLISGQVARVGKSFQVNVKILAGTGNKTLFVHSSKLLATEEDVINELNSVAAAAVAKVRAQLFPQAPAEVPVHDEVSVAASPGRPWVRLWPALVGVGAAVASGLVLTDANDKYKALSYQLGWPTLQLADAEKYRNDGKTELGLGIALGVVAVVAIVAGMVWFLRG